MAQRLAIIEGNHEGLVKRQDGAIYGAAESFAACLSGLDDTLGFSVIRPHFSDHDYHDGLLDDCDGVIFTGSANHWSADDALAKPARQMMALAFAQSKPVFGSCYGLQLAVTVLGGRNRSHPIETEFAIARDITLTKAGETHALYEGKGAVFDARCMHRDEIEIMPQGAVSLSANKHSAHQAMAYEQGGVRFWGVQYHPELQFSDIADYILRNDVASFSDAKSFATKLSLECELAEIIDDFYQLDHGDAPALQAKYQLSESVIDANYHLCEIKNFLKSL